MFKNYIDIIESIKVYLQLVNSNDAKKTIEQQIQFFEEDLAMTQNSFNEKDSIKTKQIVKATMKYADKYYRVRANELCSLIVSSLKSQPGYEAQILELEHLKFKLQDGIKDSFNNQDAFINPYPSYLFFSQEKHSGHFSYKSQREGVSGISLEQMVNKLRSNEISPDSLRVNIYLAPFRGGIHPFAYNNRTLTVFSRAKVEPSRVVPLIPTQDLLNRIKKLDVSVYPNAIFNEDEVKDQPTLSIRPGPKYN